MIAIAQILIACLGVYTLISARFQMGKGGTVRGHYARWAGVILLCSPALALFLAFVFVGMYLFTNRNTTSLDDPRILIGLHIIDIIAALLMLLIATGIAYNAPSYQIIKTGDKKEKSTRQTGSNNPFTIDEVAHRLDITPNEVLNLIHEKKLIARWFDDAYHVDRTILERYVAHHRQNDTNPMVDQGISQDAGKTTLHGRSKS
jgi:4-amino-4-deoxy-L-arabinose transferase-like glycosyltransferase